MRLLDAAKRRYSFQKEYSLSMSPEGLLRTKSYLGITLMHPHNFIEQSYVFN
ncbi:MAG: hypothetical protein QXP80_06730 [Zestosphaera sp.]